MEGKWRGGMRGKITGKKRESRVKEEGKTTGGRRKEDWKR